MPLTEHTVPAYITVAFDALGAVKIQQIQYRRIILRDGVPIDPEGTLLPTQLILAPLKGDNIEAKLTEALDAVAAGSILRIAELERDNASLAVDADAVAAAQAAEQIAALTQANNRLRLEAYDFAARRAAEVAEFEATIAKLTKDADTEAINAAVEVAEAKPE